MYHRHAGALLLTILLLAMMAACATQQAITTRVNPRHDEGVEYAPQELYRMMSELQYQRLRIRDPATGQSVAVAEEYGEYRLLFQSLQDTNIRVDVHIDKQDSEITLYFYNLDNSPPGNSALQLYEQLLQRLRFEYGTENVSSSHR
jgi:hypothetical protein